MNKSNLLLASVLAILFTSILIIISPTSQKPSPSSPSTSPAPTESISLTPDPTANWKTYESEELDFSLEIPNYLIAKSHPNSSYIDFWNESDDTTGYYKYYRNPLNDPESYKTPLFWIYLDGNSIKELQGDGNGPSDLIYIKPTDEIFNLYSWGQVFIDQVCATEKNGKTIMIECSDKNLSDPLFNQILSTFKFIDLNLSSSQELLNILNQKLNANLAYKVEIDGDKTVKILDLSDYYNSEFSVNGGKLDIIEQTLIDSGLFHDPKLDKFDITYHESLYQSEKLDCILGRNEEFLHLRCFE